MADNNINTGDPIRFESGGIFKLDDGTDTHTIETTEPGTLQVEEGGRQALEYKDRGTPQTPVRGDKEYSEIRLNVKLTSMAAGEVLKLLGEDASSGANPTTFSSLEISWKDDPDASTGDRLTFTTVWAPHPPRIRAGAEFDTVEIALRTTDSFATKATY